MPTIGIIRQVNIQKSRFSHEKPAGGMSLVRFEIEGLTRLTEEECARLFETMKLIAEGDKPFSP